MFVSSSIVMRGVRQKSIDGSDAMVFIIGCTANLPLPGLTERSFGEASLLFFHAIPLIKALTLWNMRGLRPGLRHYIGQ